MSDFELKELMNLKDYMQIQESKKIKPNVNFYLIWSKMPMKKMLFLFIMKNVYKESKRMKKIDFYFDFASPNAYLSHKVIQKIKESSG